MSDQEENFREKLDAHYDWPANYLFKFIVPTGKEEQIKSIFPEGQEIRLKSSAGGKYTSASIDILMNSSNEVMDVYRKAYEIEGIISL